MEYINTLNTTIHIFWATKQPRNMQIYQAEVFSFKIS